MTDGKERIDERLSRREREVMDIVLAGGEVTAEDVRSRLTNPPSYSTARAILSRLEAKGFVRHHEKGMRYVYRANISRAQARDSAAKRLVRVFYEGSLAKAVAGLVGTGGEKLTDEELDMIEQAIAEARRSSRDDKKTRGES
jgi:predicted transcriptional regulator